MFDIVSVKLLLIFDILYIVLLYSWTLILLLTNLQRARKRSISQKKERFVPAEHAKH